MAAASGSEEPKKKGRRKRPKGPNPLSVKRSKKFKHTTNKPNHSETSSSSQVGMQVLRGVGPTSHHVFMYVFVWIEIVVLCVMCVE